MSDEDWDIVRKSVTTALGHCVGNRPEKVSECLADTLGFIKAKWHGSLPVAGVNVSTRQGFVIIGGGTPTLDVSGIRVATGRKEPADASPPAGTPAKPTATTRPAQGGRCCECNGLMMVVGDVARCGNCDHEEPIPTASPRGGGEPIAKTVTGLKSRGVVQPPHKVAEFNAGRTARARQRGEIIPQGEEPIPAPAADAHTPPLSQLLGDAVAPAETVDEDDDDGEESIELGREEFLPEPDSVE